MPAPPDLQPNRPLAPLTTLELGGPARHYAEVRSVDALVQALRWGREEGLGVRILGGGSNVVIPDAGIDGLVLRVAIAGVEVEQHGDIVELEAGAGESWDHVVELACGRGWSGIECLAGIPGTVGATPVQNVGAYGQEVAQTLVWVEVVDRDSLAVERWPAEACDFGYRSSRLRRHPDRWVVTRVRLRLRDRGVPEVHYAELERQLRVDGTTPDPATVRAAVLELRRAKSMVIEAGDPNRRSVGSFFVNPVLTREAFTALCARCRERGLVDEVDAVPRFVTAGDTLKVPAAWLIEAAGFRKGERRGPVGISSAHALALVHHGGGTTGELLALARCIRDRVLDVAGVRLVPEPTLWGQSAL